MRNTGGRQRHVSGRSADWAALVKALNVAPNRHRRRPAVRAAAAVGRMVRPSVWRYRRQLAPLACMTMVWLVGLGVGGAKPAGVATIGVLTAGVVYWVTRRRRTRPVEQAWAVACVLAATGWLTAAAAGVRLPGVVLIAVGTALSLRWWYRHRARPDTTNPEVTPTGTVALWDAHVGDNGGKLPGATLGPPLPAKHGQQHDVQFVPGRQHLSDAVAALPFIASGLKRPMDELLLEGHPSGDPSRAQLQVITRSPIKKTVMFDQPRYTNGNVHLGPYADGMGDATYRLYTPDSMWGGFILGSQGSGKSRMLEGIAISCIATGHTVIFYIDGQDGASSPMLWKHATWTAGTDMAMGMLIAIERIMAMRQKYNVAHGLSGFTPTPVMPGILVIIDEQHAIVNDRNAERWAHVSRAGRKVGVALLGGDQDSGLNGTFGGLDVLRSTMLNGNGLVMRTNSRIAGRLIPGLTLDAYDLPVLPGYGYQVAAPGSDARTAPFRARYLPDAKAKAADPTITVPTVEEWFERLPDTPLDDMSARAAGRDYLHRHELAEQRRAELLVEINGRGAAHSTPEVIEAEPVDEEATEASAGPTAELILAVVRDRTITRQQLIAELPPGTNLSTLRKATAALVAAGLIERVNGQRGVYRAPATEAA